MDTVHQEEYKGYRISIHPDDDAESPRKWANVGTMTCFHRRYKLGDEHDFSDPSELTQWLNEHDVIELDLFLLDHSGITMNTVGFRDCDPAGWDWGKVGVIYVEEAKAIKEFGPMGYRKKALTRMQQEVETYDQYLQGDVYGFIVAKEEKCSKCGHVEHDQVDSCWGFFEQECCLSEAKSVVDSLVEDGT